MERTLTGTITLIKMDQGVMVMKKHSTFPKALELDSYHQMQFDLIYRCSILTSDPAKHAIPKTVEVHIPLAWASLADSMGQG